jgi:hypothetical protein
MSLSGLSGLSGLSSIFNGVIASGVLLLWPFNSDLMDWDEDNEWTWEETGGRGGGGCALATITPTRTTKMGLIYTQVLPSAKTFTFSAYVKSTFAFSGEIQLIPYDVDGFPIGDTISSYPALVDQVLTDWQKLEISGSIPAGTVEVDIYLYATNPNYDHELTFVYFDDVCLKID